MRIIKMISLLTLGLATFFQTKDLFVNAEENVNYNDFSKYLNVYKNDVFNEVVHISPNYNAISYNVGVSCFNKYNLKDIKVKTPSFSDYGFKVNGEFFIETVKLDEDGVYKLEVFRTEEKEGIIRPKGKTPLETINITVDLSYKLEIEKMIFAVDMYDSSTSLLEAIEGAFNYPVSISESSKNVIVNKYKEIKEFGIPLIFEIEVYFESEKTNHKITLTTSNKIDLSHFKDLKEASLNIKPIALLYNPNFKNTNVEDSLGKDIVDVVQYYLDLPKDQEINFGFNSKTSYPTLNKENYKKLSINLFLKDILNSNNQTYIEISLLIYNELYIKEENLNISFLSNDYYINQKNLNDYILEMSFKIDGKTYIDLINTPIISNFVLDFENEILTINLDFEGIKSAKKIEINIVENLDKNVRLITNYNYILLKDEKDIEYQNQISILLNGKVIEPENVIKEGYEIKNELLTENNKEYIKSTLKNNEDKIIDEIKTPIYYTNRNKQNSFWKFIETYSDFLKNIF